MKFFVVFYLLVWLFYEVVTLETARWMGYSEIVPKQHVVTRDNNFRFQAVPNLLRFFRTFLFRSSVSNGCLYRCLLEKHPSCMTCI